MLQNLDATEKTARLCTRAGYQMALRHVACSLWMMSLGLDWRCCFVGPPVGLIGLSAARTTEECCLDTTLRIISSVTLQLTDYGPRLSVTMGKALAAL